MNPPDRVAAFEAFKGDQKARHSLRCGVLAKLGALDNATLASDLIDNVRGEFKNLNVTELKAIKALYESLTGLKHAKQDEAEKRREVREEAERQGVGREGVSATKLCEYPGDLTVRSLVR